MQTIQTNRETKQMRYQQINQYYIEDTYTGQKLDQKQTINRLNQYEHELTKTKEENQ